MSQTITLKRLLVKSGDEVEIKVEVEYTGTPGCRGYRDETGQQIDPDEPPDVEVDSITLNGQEFAVTEDELDYIHDVLLDLAR